MSNVYQTIKKVKINRSNFDLSYNNCVSMNMGRLVPILCKEVVPGDKFSIKADAFVRFEPMLAPVFSKIKVAMHFWYVPNRLLWKDWNDFLTGQNVEVVPPYFLFENGINRSSLLDYLGYPANTQQFNSTSGAFDEQVNIGSTVKVSAMPVRAYDLIYNWFYRDEELQNELTVSLDGGLDESTSQDLQYRAWRKDYFTSARAQAQYGDGVVIPIGESAPVVYGDSVASSNFSFRDGSSDAGKDVVIGDRSDGRVDASYLGVNSTSNPVSSLSSTGGIYKLEADLSDASAIDIIKLRLAAKMQQIAELKNVSGNRINEYLQAFYGTKTSDARLQIPEFLGGSVSDALISEIVQTSQSTETSAQGNMSGHGVAYNGGNIQVKSRNFTEHGFIIGIMNIQPARASYCQGVNRQLTRETQYDFGLPILENIGEQEILNKEIFGGSADPDGVFGHAPRYAEYKSYQDEFHGDFLSSTADDWHTGRIFANAPQLNSDFIECKPSARIFADDSDDHDKLKARVQFTIRATRPFSYYSEPGIIKL